MEDKEEMRKMVETNLRSVTLSCKGGVPLDRLERDYKAMLGTGIPYRELGFFTLERMIEKMPNVARLAKNEMGRSVVIGVADETTRHIKDLVSKQKPSKTKLATARPRFRGSGLRRGHTRTFPNFSRNQFVYTWKIPKKPLSKIDYFETNRSSLSQRQSSPPLIQSTPPLRQPTPPLRQNFIPDSKIDKPSRGDAVTKVSKVPEPPPPQARRNPPFEVPPRFLKHQLNISPGTRNSTSGVPNDIIQPSAYSPEIVSPSPASTLNSLADQFYPVNNATTVCKIPSPKVKTKRKSETAPPLPSQLSHRDIVAEYANSKNIECRYVTKEIGQKRKRYISTLYLGERNFQTFPTEKNTKEEAERYAASLAVEAINEEEQHVQFLEAQLNTAEEIHIFLQRIEAIVAEKSNGIWSIGVPKEYERKFSESLPSHWFKLLKENSPNNIDISMPSERLHVPKGACILKFKNSGSATPTSTSSKTSSQLNEDFSNFTLAPNFFKFPEENQWPVLITYVCSTIDIALQIIIDDGDQFRAMTNSMKEFYKERCSQFGDHKLPQIGKLYSACQKVNNEDVYYRVRINHVNLDKKEASCYFVDIGETSTLNFSDLQELDLAFEALPFQAIHISLHGLEDYVELVKLSNLDAKLLDKTFIADIQRRDDNCISAILYDTSGTTDVNLNMVLKEITLEDSVVCPSLPKVGSTTMCYLTHATVDGDVYLRLNAPSQCLLEIELEKLSSKFEEAPPVSYDALSMDKVYVATYLGIYYRTVLSCPVETNASEVEMFYIDYGNSAFVPLNNVKDLGSISSFLASWPFQAIPCTLSDVPPPNHCWNETVLSKLYELAPDNQELIAKVDKSGEDPSLPEVILLMRNDQDAIISINETLSLSQHLFR